jgi:hypothetical protein
MHPMMTTKILQHQASFGKTSSIWGTTMPKSNKNHKVKYGGNEIPMVEVYM